eukprot:8112894-Alexandrium_andersonii.AAC.1
MHPSGASGTNFEAVPGSAQFKLRALNAMLRFPRGGFGVQAECIIGAPSADCGLHLGPLAMQHNPENGCQAQPAERR